MATKKTEAGAHSTSSTGEAVAAFKHSAKRKNIPAAGLEAQGRIEQAPRIRHEYNPHLPPVFRSAPDAGDADQLLALLRNALLRALGQPEHARLLKAAADRPLTADEIAQLKCLFEAAVTPGAAEYLADALRRHEPWLEWSGKREKPWFEVEPVALHMHERLSTLAILRVLAREDVNRDLFADPQQEYAKAVQFYQHDVDWANRMILGDSLAVMASLARREDLAGKMQMIYIDPPYGIKFSSNFQPLLGQRDVKDREQDLTREPETVRAYRDTWTLGIHSYLAYLRDRLAMAKELLADTGSIFVQISDKNLHLVRCVMDDVFKTENFVITIVVKKKSTTTPTDPVCDYILWFAKDREKLKLKRLYQNKLTPDDDPKFNTLVLENGELRRVVNIDENEMSALIRAGAKWARVNYPLVSQDPSDRSKDFHFHGKPFSCGTNRHWTYDLDTTMVRFAKSERIFDGGGDSLGAVVYWEDWSHSARSNIWDDVHGEPDPIYVVQTSYKVIERCLLMTTDPGDLVLDPTCGSGTTAYVAEQWGRRWITCDTSRVALALARQRLMTTRLPYYQLRPLSAEDLQRNPQGTWLSDPTGQIAGKVTFKCKTVPHITLGTIARNTSLDPIFATHEPILAERLKALNAALKSVTTEMRQKLIAKLAEKQKRDGKKSITEADRRRWELPKTVWQEWEVPYDTDPDWPKALKDALTAYRAAWRAKMDEVNECIAANAEMEELVDKPDESKAVVRVAGPFTMEGVIALEDGPDTPIGGAPDELETFEGEDEHSGDIAVANAEAHLDKILRLLKATGVDFPKNTNQKFTRLEPVSGASLVHAEGEWANGDGKERRVAVSIGPEIGNISVWQVEEVIRQASRRGYDDLVFAGFGFDAAAQDAIESGSHPHLRLHMALIRPDVAMGDLLKTQPGSQLFTVFSAPRIKGPTQQKDGQYVVEVEGMDVYDPVSNTLFPTDKERIATWFLDSDYDGRTFCVCQAFFPDKTKWDKLARALGDKGVIDPGAFDALSGLVSLPFPRPPRLKPGEKWRVAVKVIDPRGNEGLRVKEV